MADGRSLKELVANTLHLLSAPLSKPAKKDSGPSKRTKAPDENEGQVLQPPSQKRPQQQQGSSHAGLHDLQATQAPVHPQQHKRQRQQEQGQQQEQPRLPQGSQQGQQQRQARSQQGLQQGQQHGQEQGQQHERQQRRRPASQTSEQPTQPDVSTHTMPETRLPQRTAAQTPMALAALPPQQRLRVGASMRPQPGAGLMGDASCFVSKTRLAVGVADGVGESMTGGPAGGEYARQIMGLAKQRADSRPGADSMQLLQWAHEHTRVPGTSTVCVVTLTDGAIRASVVGDSGFMIIREFKVVFYSTSQVFDEPYACPFQLGGLGSDSVPLSRADQYEVPVLPRDVIIVFNSGFFDNIYASEITCLLRRYEHQGLSVQQIADNLGEYAQSRATDPNCPSPYESAAREAGLSWTGGKPDDITLVVAVVESTAGKSHTRDSRTAPVHIPVAQGQGFQAAKGSNQAVRGAGTNSVQGSAHPTVQGQGNSRQPRDSRTHVTQTPAAMQKPCGQCTDATKSPVNSPAAVLSQQPSEGPLGERNETIPVEANGAAVQQTSPVVQAAAAQPTLSTQEHNEALPGASKASEQTPAPEAPQTSESQTPAFGQSQLEPRLNPFQTPVSLQLVEAQHAGAAQAPMKEPAPTQLLTQPQLPAASPEVTRIEFAAAGSMPDTDKQLDDVCVDSKAGKIESVAEPAPIAVALGLPSGLPMALGYPEKTAVPVNYTCLPTGLGMYPVESVTTTGSACTAGRQSGAVAMGSASGGCMVVGPCSGGVMMRPATEGHMMMGPYSGGYMMGPQSGGSIMMGQYSGGSVMMGQAMMGPQRGGYMMMAPGGTQPYVYPGYMQGW